MAVNIPVDIFPTRASLVEAQEAENGLGVKSKWIAILADEENGNSLSIGLYNGSELLFQDGAGIDLSVFARLAANNTFINPNIFLKGLLISNQNADGTPDDANANGFSSVTIETTNKMPATLGVQTPNDGYFYISCYPLVGTTGQENRWGKIISDLYNQHATEVNFASDEDIALILDGGYNDTAYLFNDGSLLIFEQHIILEETRAPIVQDAAKLIRLSGLTEAVDYVIDPADYPNRRFKFRCDDDTNAVSVSVSSGIIELKDLSDVATVGLTKRQYVEFYSDGTNLLEL
jgi:hypothetical protein